MTEESKRRYSNFPTLVGKFNGFNFKDVGNNGLCEVALNADGNKVKVSVWEKKDGSTRQYLKGLKEGEVVEIAFATLKQREWDGNVYIEGQVNSPKLIKPTTKEESAVVALEGDVYKFDIDSVEWDGNGMPYGNFKLLYFDTEVYNSDTGKNEDITPAEVLIGDINNRIKKLKKDYPDKATDPYEELIESLKKDDSVDNIQRVFTELVENDEYMSFYNTYLFDLNFEGKVGEKIVNEVNEKDNIYIGADIINKLVKNKYGIIEGQKTELKVGVLSRVNKKVEVKEKEWKTEF